MSVPLFILAGERGVWKQFKQLADAECFSTLRGGEHGAFERWKTKLNPQRLLSVRGLFGCRRAFGGKVNRCSRSAVTASLILFVVHRAPWSPSSIVFVLCIVQMKPGIFRLRVLCFLWRDVVEMLSGAQRALAYKKQTTNFYCNNILGLFGRWLGGFSSPLSVYNCWCILASAAT